MEARVRLPRLTAFNVLCTCVLLSLVILAGVTSRIRPFLIPLSYAIGSENIESIFVKFTKPPAQTSMSSSLRLALPGENIQVEDLQVHIATAVHNDQYPARSGFNIFLNGWARHNTSMSFKCCLLRSLSDGDLADDVFTEVKSYTYHIYDQWIVDMQNAEFSCSISKTQISSIGDANFSHVTFAKESCLNASPVVLKILHPQPVANSVGVCLKITYGSLNPEKMVEWFEYARLMGVTKVFTYYSELSPQTMQVLDYYRTIGFLEMLIINQPVSEDRHRRGIKIPRYDQQTCVNDVMAANDCKHRMATFDFVLVLDMDEFIVPKGELRSYYDVLKAASRKMHNACGFSFDSQVWGPARSSPLHICRYINSTGVAKYDGADINIRWAFRPTLTYWVQNNLVHCRKPYMTTSIPDDIYVLFNYHFCKNGWIGCPERAREKDSSMLKYQLPLSDRILNLPLAQILTDHKKYLYSMIDWRKKLRRYY